MRVLAGLAVMAMAQPIPAFALQTAAVPVQATPFDAKLQSADFFRNLSPAAAAASPESLFAIARSFRYRAETRDRWQTAEETERLRSGDCEDKAVWLYKKLIQSGRMDARLVVGRKSGRDRGLHVWVTLGEGDRTLLLDPAAQNRPWQASAFAETAYRPLYSYGENGSLRY
jgi:hypothetical protein